MIALGYKGEYIKRYMVDYASLEGDLTIGLREDGEVARLEGDRDDWTVDLVDTGHDDERPAAGSSASRRTSATSTFMLT